MRCSSAIAFLALGLVAVGLGCSSRKGVLRASADHSGEAPAGAILVIAALRPPPFYLVETSVRRPPVPNAMDCDWSSMPPQVRFVDPNDPGVELHDTTRQLYRIHLDGGLVPAPDLNVPYDFQLSFDRASKAFAVDDGGIKELPVTEVTGRSLWVALVCAKGEEIAVEADWFDGREGSGKLVVLRREGTSWVVVATRDTWVS